MSLVEKIKEYVTHSDVTRPRNLLYMRRYYKGEMVHSITRHLKSGPNFTLKLYNGITKQEMKKAYYGILCVNDHTDFPAFVDDLSRLTEKTFEEYKIKTNKNLDFDLNWFKVTFFAGLWEKIVDYNNPEKRSLTKEKVLECITPYDLIKRGYDTIQGIYAIRRNKGEYTRKEYLKIPGSQFFNRSKGTTYEILSHDISELIDLFSLSEKYQDSKIKEDICQKLNEVNNNTLEIMSLLYGEEVVNNYKNLNVSRQTKKKRKPKDISELPLFRSLFK